MKQADSKRLSQNPSWHGRPAHEARARCPCHPGQAGFTLVEMLVVLVIIMSLSGIATVNVLRFQAKARRDTAALQIKQMVNAVRLYESEQGRIPTMEQGLRALVAAPSTPPLPKEYPDGGYLDSRQVPVDPWKNDYIYVVPGRQGAAFEILSYGRDGEPGGSKDDADISSLDQ